MSDNTGRPKIGGHPEPSVQDRGFDCLKLAHQAAQDGDRTTRDIEIGKARILLPAAEIDAICMENRFRFDLPLPDARLQEIHPAKYRRSFADCR